MNAAYKSIKRSLLKAIDNPVNAAYEVKIKIPECTFLGVHAQPDFADIYLVFYPDKQVIELKSLKQYIVQLRNVVVSYERLVNVIYDHLFATYQPKRLRVVMICNPRGGISSRLTVDSDWSARGGAEAFGDWRNGEDDAWSVVL